MSCALGSSFLILDGLAARGRSMRDLISASIAAMSRYSAASSKLHGVHELDVLHVLFRNVRHVDIEDVQILTPDEVEQQIQRDLRKPPG
jgi:hypothetical protein